MLVLGKRNRKFKLGMCYFADDGTGDGAGGAGGASGAGNGNSATDDKSNEAKFTQADLNKLVSERINEQNAKHEKEMAELKAKMERDAELSKMNENERVKAELEDYKKKLQEAEDKNALSIQTEETRKMLEEAKVPTSFLKFVLVPKDPKQTQININELKTVFDSEVKKGVEEQIKPHQPKGGNSATGGNDDKKVSGPSYTGLRLQNSIEEYYNKKQ